LGEALDGELIKTNMRPGEAFALQWTDGINGVTEYSWDRKPTVKIDARLTQPTLA